jgi:hypothetical protein
MGGIPNGNRFTSADSGAAHWNWKGGITNQRRIEMGKMPYIRWRKAVFERDDYTCQMCGKRGGWMDADHILPWSTHVELRYEVSNGRTLCRPCHAKTPTYGAKASALGKPSRQQSRSPCSSPAEELGTLSPTSVQSTSSEIDP